jgi:hypothetical protein
MLREAVARAGGQQGRGTGPEGEEDDALRKRKQEVDGDGLLSGGRRGSTAGGRQNRAEQGRHVLGEEEKKERVRRTCLKI